MANIWHLDGSVWTRLPLAGDFFALHAGQSIQLQPALGLPVRDEAVGLGCYPQPAGDPLWVLFCAERAAIRVNGELLTGIAVMRDRDEILLQGGTRLYFSTEETARVEPFPAGEVTSFCARCHKPLRPGTPAVRCPKCGHWCEQSDKQCWTYGPTCPLCDQMTALDAELRWTPQDL